MESARETSSLRTASSRSLAVPWRSSELELSRKPMVERRVRESMGLGLTEVDEEVRRWWSVILVKPPASELAVQGVNTLLLVELSRAVTSSSELGSATSMLGLTWPQPTAIALEGHTE
jgi:hypothetical protein